MSLPEGSEVGVHGDMLPVLEMNHWVATGDCRPLENYPLAVSRQVDRDELLFEEVLEFCGQNLKFGQWVSPWVLDRVENNKIEKKQNSFDAPPSCAG